MEGRSVCEGCTGEGATGGGERARRCAQAGEEEERSGGGHCEGWAAEWLVGLRKVNGVGIKVRSTGLLDGICQEGVSGGTSVYCRRRWRCEFL